MLSQDARREGRQEVDNNHAYLHKHMPSAMEKVKWVGEGVMSEPLSPKVDL